jgi:hypothetical protein
MAGTMSDAGEQNTGVALRDMLAHDPRVAARKERSHLHLFILIVFGDMLGLTICRPLRLFVFNR